MIRAVPRSPFTVHCSRCLLLVPRVAMAQTTDRTSSTPRQLIKAAPLIDGHNDLAWEIRTSKTAPLDVDAYDLRQTDPGHTDFARLARRRGRRAVLVDLHPGRGEGQRLRQDPARGVRHRPADDREVPGQVRPGAHRRRHRGGHQGREDRVPARHGGRARHRELARRAAHVLRPRRAVHDADPQRHARLGRRGAGHAGARRAHRRSGARWCAR